MPNETKSSLKLCNLPFFTRHYNDQVYTYTSFRQKCSHLLVYASVFLHFALFSTNQTSLIKECRLWLSSRIKSYMSNLLLIYPCHMLVFVDETGSDCRDAMRKYEGGTPKILQALSERRVSVITAMKKELLQ